jgi:hypothetical protein
LKKPFKKKRNPDGNLTGSLVRCKIVFDSKTDQYIDMKFEQSITKEMALLSSLLSFEK